jgi:hypothetical protein
MREAGHRLTNQSAAVATVEALFRSMAAYAGTHTIKGGQAIHHLDCLVERDVHRTDQFAITS